MMAPKIQASVSVRTDNMAMVEQATRALRDHELLVGYPMERSKQRGIATAFIGPLQEEMTMNNATLAYIHNHGSAAAHIPPRPFMNQGIERRREAIARDLEKGAKSALEGNLAAVTAAFNSAGLRAQAGIREQITTGSYQKLSKATLAARKRAGFKGIKPLVRSGQMNRAVDYVIRPRS